MAGEKQAALDYIDAQVTGKNHAELNTKPGVRVAKVLAELRALVAAITEA